MTVREPPAPSPFDARAVARRILRSVPMASLATAARDAEDWPYASLVALAVDHGGQPLMLLSRLADHTLNLERDDRASLLLDATGNVANRMAGERLTLMGRVAPLDGAALAAARTRYLARHPAAAAYEGFADFAYYGMTVARVHLIGGFAKAAWLDAADVMPRLPRGYALAEAEAEILEHMNDEHLDAVRVYANVLAKRPGAGWRLTGVDAEGIDLRRGGDVARVAFAAPVADAEGAKAALIALVQRARATAARS